MKPCLPLDSIKLGTEKECRWQCTISFPRKYYFLSVYTEKSTISFPIRTEVLFLFRTQWKSTSFFSRWIYTPFPNRQKKYYFLSELVEVLFLFRDHWKSAISFPHEYYFLSESVEVLFLFRLDRAGSMNLGKIYLKVLFHFQAPPKCDISFPLITISFPRKHYFFSASS